MPRAKANPTPAELAERERRAQHKRNQRANAAMRDHEVPPQASGKLSRLQRLREGGRTWEELRELPGLRHIGDVEGTVLRADLSTVFSATVALPVAHVLPMLEAVSASMQGQLVFMRLYVVDPPTDWIEVKG